MLKMAKMVLVFPVLAFTAVCAWDRLPEKETGNTATRKPVGQINRMFPDGTVHDFGRVDRGELCKHSFRIVNTCGVPLRIVSLRIS